MSRKWALISATFLLCAALDAGAATITGQSDALTPLLPARGAYYDSSKPGTGVSIDVGDNGFVLMAYYGYSTLGAPEWFTVQGTWTPASEAQRLASGIVGTLDAPLLQMNGGQCITCDFSSKPSVTTQPYPVSVSWTTPRHLDLTIGSQRWHMDAVQYARTDADTPTGTWQLTISWDADDSATQTGSGVAARSSVVHLGAGVRFLKLPIITSVSLDPAADASIALPPPTSEYFPVDEANVCAPGPVRVGTYGAAFSDIFAAVKQSSLFAGYPLQYLAPLFWYDAGTQHFALDVVTRAMGVDTIPMALGPNNIHFDLYPQPDRIIGHGYVQGQNLNGIPAGYWQPNQVMLNLVMQRLPDGVVERSIYPCMLY